MNHNSFINYWVVKSLNSSIPGGLRSIEAQKQLSKEFVRQWLISNGFQGLEGQTLPEMTDEYIETVSDRYIELYENITGETFVKADISNIHERIENNVLDYLLKIK